MARYLAERYLAEDKPMPAINPRNSSAKAGARESSVAPLALREMIGNRIRKSRLDAGLTIEDLANSIGLAQARLGMIEAGQSMVGAEELFDISRVLNRKISFFFETVYEAD